MGIAMFAILVDLRVLDPTYVDWLFEGDRATHFFGWYFFRNDPWGMPLGRLLSYGMGIGGSIVFTDSIPLLAFLFKPFSNLLPEYFQYFGLWILLCMTLQGIYSWLLLEEIVSDRRMVFFGTLLLMFSPVMIVRLADHLALSAHWLILAAFLVYLRQPRREAVAWTGLMLVALLVHAYLFFMVAAVWIASLLRRILTKRERYLGLFASASLSLVLIGVTMWLTGYFSFATVGSFKFGYYRMNLLSPLNGSWFNYDFSWLLPEITVGPGDYEGFNFLGAGVFLLWFIVGCRALLHKEIPFALSRTTVPLVCMSVVLTILALSNKIAAGSVELLEVPLPKILNYGLGIFQSSGRMFWPVWYLLIVTVLALVARMFSPSRAVTIVAVASMLQLSDMSPALVSLAETHRLSAGWHSPLKDCFWESAGRRFRQIWYVSREIRPADYLPLAHLAASHRMAVNFGHFARYDYFKLKDDREKLLSLVENGSFDHTALYIFDDPVLWRRAQVKMAAEDVAFIVDGVMVIAPGWRGNIAHER